MDQRYDRADLLLRRRPDANGFLASVAASDASRFDWTDYDGF